MNKYNYKLSFTKEKLEQEYKSCRSTEKIAKKYQVSGPAIRYWFKKFGIICNRDYNLKILTGQRFKQLIVLYRVVNNKSYDAKWKCKCDCGKFCMVLSSVLIRGDTLSCGCYGRNKRYKGYEDLSGLYWRSLKSKAKQRNLKFVITIKQAWQQFIKQNKKCALSGRVIRLIRNYGKYRCLQTASLDRINSNKGYTVNNIQWLHKKVNIMKNCYTEKEFISFCRDIVAVSDGELRKN